MSLYQILKHRENELWINPKLRDFEPDTKIGKYGFVYLHAAQNRFMRILPYIAAAFPETEAKKGVIESGITENAECMKKIACAGVLLEGRSFFKDDSLLPVYGAVETRGAVNEVMKQVEMISQEKGKLLPTDNYGKIDSEEFAEFLGKYTLSASGENDYANCVRLLAQKLGFQYSDSRALESEAGKKLAVAFDSEDAFFGYSTAATRIKIQLYKAGVNVDAEHPMFFYLPSENSAAACGICFGLKQLFGNNVHVFLTREKTAANASDDYEPSAFACEIAETIVSGVLSVPMQDCEGLKTYLEQQGLSGHMNQATHVVWKMK